jgi:hypothetical protein
MPLGSQLVRRNATGYASSDNDNVKVNVPSYYIIHLFRNLLAVVPIP